MIFFFFISHSSSLSLSILNEWEGEVYVIPGSNLLNNGLHACGVQHRWKSNKFTLLGSLSVNNIELFLWKCTNTKQFPRYCIKWRCGNVHRKTRKPIARAVVCYIPASFYIIYVIKMMHLLHQQMLWIYYKLVALHICNRTATEAW